MTNTDMIIYEANKYFERNGKEKKIDEASRGTKLVADFISRFNAENAAKIQNFCEIGCSYGYNLFYLQNKLSLKCSGIEPSPKAVEYGLHKSVEYSVAGGYTSFKAYQTIFLSKIKNLMQ